MSSSARIMRVAKIMRVFRIMRVIKLVKFFRRALEGNAGALVARLRGAAATPCSMMMALRLLWCLCRFSCGWTPASCSRWFICGCTPTAI